MEDRQGMLRALVFNTLFLIAIGYAFARGRRAERVVAATFVLAWMATVVALRDFSGRFTTPEIGVFAIDLATFAALLGVAFRADRFWPMPLAAMQGVSVLAHIAELMRPDLADTVYTNAVQLWSYPQLVLLCLGTLRVDLRRYDYRLGRWPFPR